MTAKAKLPPAPKDPKYRQALGLGIGIWDYMEKNQRELGDTFTLTLPGQGPMVWTSNQDMIKDILKLQEEQVDASLVQLPMDLGEHNTVFLNEKEHQDSRKIVIPAFNTTRLRARAPAMHDIVTEHINSWKVGQKLNVPRMIGDITLDVICYTLFNLRHGERKDRYQYLMGNWMLEATSDTMFTFGAIFGAKNFRQWLNKKYLARADKNQGGNGKKGILPWKRAVDLKVQLADMIREDIRDIRRRMDESETHLLSVIARAKDDKGNLLSEERVISETIGLLIGGHETSAATASWFAIWLQQRPDVNDKIRREVLESIQNEGKFDPVKVSELPYLTACLNESQRLTPSAVGFIRWLRQDTQLGSHLIPAGSSVLPCIYLTHRDPAIFGPDVLEYRPERWMEGKKYLPSEFLPFGGGRRACVGLNQARQQLRIAFAEFARRVEFTSEYQHSNKMPRSRMIGGQTEPEKGVWLTVKQIRPESYGMPDTVGAAETATA
ncbi:Predicted cytochrome P450 [gamma proteobacterium HdN1]|nr:Predicted cytochrome P450 [gamma proteobacterium HdN1]